MFKLAHISDIHLGYRSTRLTNNQGFNIREMDGVVGFSRVIDQIIKAGVDAVLVTGDMFHIPTPEIHTIIFAQNEMRRLSQAGIKVYILAGNHDTTDVRSTRAASLILHDPARNIHSYAANTETYFPIQIAPDITAHIIPHHLYSEQAGTMQSVKTVESSVNILATHGSVIDPLLKEKLHTALSPREIVIPDFLLNDHNWDQILLGHIHERGYVGSKDGKSDSLKTKIYYNGSLIRRGFSDKPCKLGRGWTEWHIDSSGKFIPTFHEVLQRPQSDFPMLDAKNKTSKQISEEIIANLVSSQINGPEFDSKTAPILRQRIKNIEISKYSALDWAAINSHAEHALQWNIKLMSQAAQEDDSPALESSNTLTEIGDVVKVYDDWINDSEALKRTEKDLKAAVQRKAREFVESGQEVTLSD